MNLVFRAKLKFLAIVATLWCLALSANGQLQDDRIQYYAGISFEYIDIYRDSDGEPLGGLSFTAFTLGGHYQIAHIRDKAAFTVNPNGSLGFVLSNFAGAVMFQLPVYFMGRVGAQCTKFNENRIRLGFGVGPKFNYVGVRVDNFSVSQSFVAPAAALELNIGSRSGNVFTIRVHTNLVMTQGDFDTVKARYANYGFGFVYFFDELF